MALRQAQETTLEDHFLVGVRRRGGQSFKFAPLVKGNPDRLVLLPGGRIYLVELKADSGSLSPKQILWHRRAWEGQQVRVIVLQGRAHVDEWLESV